MNLRERFNEVMAFNTGVHSVKWEFGYWGEVLDRWYESGLPEHHYPDIPEKVNNATDGLYNIAWKSIQGGRLPKGIAVMGGGLYWPTQSFPLDHDVRAYFGMDYPNVMIPVNQIFHPMFEVQVSSDDEKQMLYTDIDGVTRRFLKETATMPSGEAYPIKDRKSWEKLKAERINMQDIKGRLPANWDELVKEYRNRDYPLALMGYPHGFFGILANLMGYETLFYSYIDDPELIHDIVDTFTKLWICLYEEVLSYTDVDLVHIWEDISYGSGSMISLKVVREFMLPYYKRFTDFLKGKGVKNILVDTDGYCWDLIPLFLEGGATGMYPFETACGMDIVKVRKTYPQLQMMGGIPKSQIGLGKEAIDAFLEPVEEVLKTGGYIPFGDHFIPPEVTWDGFQYYRNRLNQIIDRYGE
jgi:uroporphyrinogen decarboxylase